MNDIAELFKVEILLYSNKSNVSWSSIVFFDSLGSFINHDGNSDYSKTRRFLSAIRDFACLRSRSILLNRLYLSSVCINILLTT